MRALHLALKSEYFDAIRDGTKAEEFRLATPYWAKRLEAREYDIVVLTKGYPKAGDPDRTLIRKWRGAYGTTITHPHFGPEPVDVYAIDVSTAP